MRSLAIILLGLSLTVAAAGSGEEYVSSVDSPVDAIERAIAYCGVECLNGFARDRHLGEVTVVAFEDSTTPYLAHESDGRRAWQVVFSGLILNSYDVDESLWPEYPKDMTVYIDSTAGQLLCVYMQTSGLRMDRRVQRADSDAATAKMMRQEERYVDLPKVQMTATFVECLDEVVGSALVADEVVAHYVVHSCVRWEDRLVWTIHLYGIPPIPVISDHRDEVPEYMKTHRRSVVDAQTGSLLFAINSPHPKGPGGEKPETTKQKDYPLELIE